MIQKNYIIITLIISQIY